jgi:hypothetical protein
MPAPIAIGVTASQQRRLKRIVNAKAVKRPPPQTLPE